MTFSAKAQHLVDTRQASNYSEACSILARRRPKRITVSEKDVTIVGTRPRFWWIETA